MARAAMALKCSTVTPPTSGEFESRSQASLTSAVGLIVRFASVRFRFPAMRRNSRYCSTKYWSRPPRTLTSARALRRRVMASPSDNDRRPRDEHPAEHDGFGHQFPQLGLPGKGEEAP